MSDQNTSNERNEQERRHAGNFRQRLLAMGFASYAEYLDSPTWAGFVRRFFETPSYCAVCGAPARAVRHLSCSNVGAETRDDVVALCMRHDDAVHLWLDRKKNGQVSATRKALAALRRREGQSLSQTRRDEAVAYAISLGKQQSLPRTKTGRKKAKAQRRKLRAMIRAAKMELEREKAEARRRRRAEESERLSIIQEKERLKRERELEHRKLVEAARKSAPPPEASSRPGPVTPGEREKSSLEMRRRLGEIRAGK